LIKQLKFYAAIAFAIAAFFALKIFKRIKSFVCMIRFAIA